MYKLLAASALSLALLSGTAIAQVSVGGGAQGDVGVNIGESITGDATADTEMKLEAETGGMELDADASTSADADTAVETDELDTATTAAVGAGAEINAVLDSFGDDANAFFADEARTEVKSEAEIQAAFNALTSEQQDELRSACAGAAGSGAASAGGASAGASGSAGLCAAIENL